MNVADYYTKIVGLSRMWRCRWCRVEIYAPWIRRHQRSEQHLYMVEMHERMQREEGDSHAHR